MFSGFELYPRWVPLLNEISKFALHYALKSQIISYCQLLTVTIEPRLTRTVFPSEFELPGFYCMLKPDSA